MHRHDNALNVTRWGALLCALLTLHCGADGADGAEAGGSGGTSSAGAPSAGTSSAGTSSAGTSSAGKPSFGGAVTVVPGAPNCGLADAAAFCDQFEEPSANMGRAGELDSALWSGSRAQPQLPTRDGLAIGIAPGTLPPCRPDLPEKVYPNGDAVICDPSTAIPSNHLLVVAAAQNYGQHSFRVRQPFDFADRTGKIVFDAQGFIEDQLLGWVSISVTEDPISAPSFAVGGANVPNDEGAQLPRNGLEIQFQDECAGFFEPPVVGVRMLLVYQDYVATVTTPETKLCVKTKQGHLNHFEISVSPTKVEVFVSDFSEKDGAYDEPQLLLSANVSLPFSRGYVSINTHNHATIKYSEGNALDAWVARWDNVGFDGPKLANTREYEVADALVLGDDPQHTAAQVMNIGYRLADAAGEPAQQLRFSGVDTARVSKAQLALSCWYLTGDATASYTLKYRLNGGNWHDHVLSDAEAKIISGGSSQGQLAHILDVPIGELVSGDNTLELVTDKVPTNYPAVVSNIDLILSE